MTENQVIRELSGRLPPGISVAAPATRTELARETLFSSEQGLNMAAGLSLVAAAFIIVNSLFMNLSERRRQLATLRTIGATRLQIFGLVVREGLLLGVAGTMLGILAGIGGAALLTRVMEGVFQTTLPVFRVSLEPVLKAALLGPGLSFAAVLLPAWTATRISPLEGMRPVPVEATAGRGRWVTLLAAVLMALGAVGGVALHQGILAPPSTPAVVASSLVGMSLLIPHFLAASVRLLTRVVEWSGSVNAFLACRQILRQRNRSSLTAGVLFVAIVMSVGMGNSVLNSTQDVKDWVDRRADRRFRGPRHGHVRPDDGRIPGDPRRGSRAGGSGAGGAERGTLDVRQHEGGTAIGDGRRPVIPGRRAPCPWISTRGSRRRCGGG